MTTSGLGASCFGNNASVGGINRALFSQMFDEVADSTNNMTASHIGEDHPTSTKLPNITDLLKLDMTTLCAFANDIIQVLGKSF